MISSGWHRLRGPVMSPCCEQLIGWHALQACIIWCYAFEFVVRAPPFPPAVTLAAAEDSLHWQVPSKCKFSRLSFAAMQQPLPLQMPGFYRL